MTVAAGPHRDSARDQLGLPSRPPCTDTGAGGVSILFGKKSLNLLSYYQQVTDTCIRTGIRTQTKELLRLLPLPLGYTDSALGRLFETTNPS